MQENRGTKDHYLAGRRLRQSESRTAVGGAVLLKRKGIFVEWTTHAVIVLFALVISACSGHGENPSHDADASGTESGSQGSGGTGGQLTGAGGNSGDTGTGGGAGSGGLDGGPADGGADVANDTGPGDAAGPKKQWSCPTGPFPAPMAGAPQTICAGVTKYNWSEGPTWIASQNAFFFSNFVQGAAGPGDMLKYTPATGQCEVFVTGDGCNGLAVAPDGNILAACQKTRAVMKYDVTSKEGTVVVDMYMGQMLDSPNDIVAHSNGTIYFTNPTFELAGRPPGLGSAVLRIDPAGVLSLIAKGGVNGIALSPDEKRLYVVGQGSWDLDDKGVPAATKNAAAVPLGNDGIAVDCAGNVYEKGGTIHDPQGQQIGQFPAGTNMAFGGPDGKTMLIAGPAGAARLVPMNLPGLP